MPKSSFLGHALHPQLVTLPLGLFPFSLAMDVLHHVTDEPSHAETARHALIGGIAGALAAGAAGAMDYFEIDRASSTKRLANVHAGLNLAATGLFGLGLALRAGRRTPSGAWPTALSVAGNALAFTSAWYGGHMVYEHGMRVRGRSEIEDAPSWRSPAERAPLERR